MTEQQYIESLAREYLALCALMTDGRRSAAEVAVLSSQRTTTHDELIRVLGEDYARPFDMQAWCSAIVRDGQWS